MTSTNDTAPKRMADLTQFEAPVPVKDEAGYAALAQAGDEAAANRLILGSFHEAIPYLYRVSNNRLPEDIVISLAYEALQKALKSYNPTFRLRFFGHAKPYLRGAVSSWWAFQDVVRGSSTLMEELPNDADATTIPEIIYGEEGSGATDMLKEHCFVPASLQEVYTRTAVQDILTLLRKHLPPHYVQVLIMHSYEGKTYKQIGKHFDGKTHAWAALIHRLALEKIARMRLVKEFTGGERVLD